MTNHNVLKVSKIKKKAKDTYEQWETDVSGLAHQKKLPPAFKLGTLMRGLTKKSGFLCISVGDGHYPVGRLVNMGLIFSCRDVKFHF